MRMNQKKVLVLSYLLMLLIFGARLSAQDPELEHTRVSLSVQNETMQKVLSDLELQIPYRFAFNSELIARQKKITLDARDMPLDTVLYIILDPASITYKVIGNQIVLQETDPRVTISGFVRDSVTGEPLPQAILYVPARHMATYANNYGFYSITLPKSDSSELWISYIGFTGLQTKVDATENKSVNFNLAESRTQINSIIIKKTNPDDNVKKVAPGKTDFSMERVRTMPSVGGNGDILSTIQMM